MIALRILTYQTRQRQGARRSRPSRTTYGRRKPMPESRPTRSLTGDG